MEQEHEGVEINVQIGGRRHTGRYTADRHGVITVWHKDFGQKITQDGGTNSLSVARSLLRQLIRDGARGQGG
jgi:hypothetical protein